MRRIVPSYHGTRVYIPGIHTPYTPWVHHSRTRPGVPHCCCRTRECSLAALTREVAELTFRHAGVTVGPVTDTRFTVGLALTSVTVR